MSKPLNRRQFVTAALAGAGVAAVAPRISFAQRRRMGQPNILFILADDLGYGDLSCYGRPDYQTSHLDRLAQEGVRLANAYSASPLCTPTRCAFITGRYPARTKIGLEEPLHERRDLGDRTLTLGLPPEHPTVASLLKQKGYETALIGKWHLGYLPNFGPVQSGFEEFFGIMSGAGDFFTHKDMAGDPDLFEGKVGVERIGYMTDMLTERAVQYISRRRQTGKGAAGGGARPFYLSLHYTAPHWPWEAAGDRPPSPELRGPAAFRSGGSLKTYAAMMKSLDDGIGEVLKTLSQAGLQRDTLVIFTSDNGGERFSYNWPFMGEKNSLWEGGIRVPGIVRWPGVIQAARANRASASETYVSGLPAGGRIVHQPMITMDWSATILAAAQVQPDPGYPLDGMDLMPALRSESAKTTAPARTFFWRNAKQDAAVKAPWKYLNDGAREYLFNLSVDHREQANFRDQNPAMFNQLRGEFKAWESTVLPRPPARS